MPPSLGTADDAVNGLLSELVGDPDTNWTWEFSYTDSSAWEKDFKKESLGGVAPEYIDNMDLAAFCGHGLGNTLTFDTEKDDWDSTPSDQDLGAHDLEWLLTFTCNFLRGSMSDFGKAADGVHLICGYATDMTVTANAGERFAYWAMHPYGVRVAWYKYGYDTQLVQHENIARIFGALASKNDYLHGYGDNSSDPLSYTSDPDSYSYWDYKLNW